MTPSSKTVLITGCSSGIGRASALLAAQRGHRVLATVRDLERARDLAGAHGSITVLPLDVTDGASLAGFVERVFALTGGAGPDTVINNAGFSAFGPVELVPLERARHCFETNVLGLLAVTQAFLPAMRRRGSGRIINISSLVGQITVPYEGIYAATKHAVEAISDALRFEVAPFGVDVVVVRPGPLNTAFEERCRSELARLPEGGGPYRRHLAGFLRHRKRAYERAPTGDAAAKVIVQALEAQRPPASILFPADAHLVRFFIGSMPERIVHLLLRNAFGIPAREARPQIPGEVILRDG